MDRRHRILVADDDADAACALAELLRFDGHAADAAIGGQEALCKLETNDYRLAFFDATLPGRSDLESFVELRARQANMRSYLMTGYSILQLLQQTAESGGVQLLRGPIGRTQALTAAKQAGAGGLILIAPDGPGEGERLRDLLAESEYAVALATEPADAQAQIEERRVHVLILDLGSRVIDAASVYAGLQAQGRARPTIIVTRGEASLGDAAATGVITKPYDPGLLLEQIDRLAA